MVDPDSKTYTYAYDTYGNRASLADPLVEENVLQVEVASSSLVTRSNPN